MPYLLEENGLIHLLLLLLLLHSELKTLNHLNLFFVNAVARTEKFLTAIKALFSMSREYLEIGVDYVPVPTHVDRGEIANNIVAARLPPLLELIVRRIKREFILLLLLFR